MKRLGCLLRFKAGITKAQAGEVLRYLQETGVLDLPEQTQVPHYFTEHGRRFVRYTERPFVTTDLVQEYYDEVGGPVWYIP